MSIARSVADVLRDHVVLEIEGIDRMHLNVYVPTLQTVGAVVGYLRVHRGQRFASTAAVAPMTEAFVRTIEEFVDREGIDLVTFGKRQRKDDVTQQRLRRFEGTEGVLYVGKAQEKARVMRTERRRSARTGGTYPWIVESTAMVNHYYFYCVDEDFGPFFLKFCSYFPYNAKLNINGHEYLKRQLAKRGVPFEAIDNGIKSCADPKLAQRLCDGLSAAKIDQLLRKWLRRLPHPFPPRDRAAGYRYQLSILQAEFALTQVLDQPVTGRIFFEEVIRENLDIGRPSQVSLVFDRKVTRRTPGRFRTRVITEGVVPSPLPPTDVCSTSNASITTALSAKRPSRTCKGPSLSTTSAPRRCASPIRAFRPCSTYCSCSSSSTARSPTRTSASISLPCSGTSRANTLPAASPTTCVACACTVSSSASRELIATASPPRACAPPCSTPGSTAAPCDPGWPSSRRPAPIQSSRWPSPFGPPKLLSTNGASMQKSQPKNLTQKVHKAVNQGP